MAKELSWDFNEVIIASTTNYVSVIDPKTGKTLKYYNVNNIAPKCLTLLGEDYFIGAPSHIPDIKVWPVRDEKISTQINSPCGLVNALTVSNCRNYCAAAFKQEIRIWNIQSGEMLSAFTRHYQDVTILKFTSNDAILLSGSKDGCVLAWIFSRVVSVNLDNPNSVKPLHSWYNHTKEVTDIFVGSHGIRSRMASSSTDMTCRIYELDTGLLLTTVCLDVPVTSVVMDSLEYCLVLGTLKGTICKINLHNEQPRELHYSSMEKDEVIAHQKAVSSLSMCVAGDKFLSIAAEDKLKIWDVASLTCILCVTDGPFHNAFFALSPAPLLTKQEPSFFVKQLERSFVSAAERSKRNGTVLHRPRNVNLTMIHSDIFDKHFHPALCGQSDLSLAEITADSKAESEFQEVFRGETINQVRDINNQIYMYMLNTLFNDVDPKDTQPTNLPSTSH